MEGYSILIYIYIFFVITAAAVEEVQDGHNESIKVGRDKIPCRDH